MNLSHKTSYSLNPKFKSLAFKVLGQALLAENAMSAEGMRYLQAQLPSSTWA